MSATLDSLTAAVNATVENLVAETKKTERAALALEQSARVERAQLVRELDAALPTCRYCGNDLPSAHSIDALCRLLSAELGKQVAAVGKHEAHWLRGYCGPVCEESNNVVPFVRPSEGVTP